MKQYFNKILYQFRTQPVVMVITLLGIAMSITFVMLYFMMNQVYEAGYAPESGRDRMLHVRSVNCKSHDGSGYGSHGPMGTYVAREVFYNLKTPQAVSAYTNEKIGQVSLPGKGGRGFSIKGTDESFWQVFDFTFLSGKPYTEEDLRSSLCVAVIDEEVARFIWGETDVVGRSLEVNYSSYKVVGVVRPVVGSALWAAGHVWIPYTTIDLTEWRPMGIQGSLCVTLLAADKKDLPIVLEETEQSLDRFNQNLLAAIQWEVNLQGQPDTQEEMMLRIQKGEVDLPAKQRRELLVFLILLVIPAINLSAMLNSRLRQRRMEIGVYRSFGAPRSAIMWDLFVESFWLSLLGGLLGLLFCLGISYGCNHWLFPQGHGIDFTTLVTVLFRWQIFGWLLLCCLVLNLLSSGIPIWRIVRMNIADSWREDV